MCALPVIPMDYSALLWSIACGWFFFATFPAEATWIGAPLIVASALFIAWREHRLHIERQNDSPPTSRRPRETPGQPVRRHPVSRNYAGGRTGAEAGGGGGRGGS